jgi:hypothetical protein
MGGVGLLEVADLSLDEPELHAISFGLGTLSIHEATTAAAANEGDGDEEA